MTQRGAEGAKETEATIGHPSMAYASWTMQGLVHPARGTNGLLRSSRDIRRLIRAETSASSRRMTHSLALRTASARQVAHRPMRRPLHPTTTRTHSTTTCDFTHSSASVKKSTEPPSMAALRTLFVASAIPMVGFGFMDNLVMIQAGQYIDSTIGVSLGLATMTAAAAGQVVSDVSGVVFGGTLERFLTKLSLIKSPNLTSSQRQLSICRNVSMAGAVVGVVIGCALGAMTLLLVDLEARNRIERAQQLREIVTDMIDDDELGCEACTVYIVDGSDFELDAEETTPQWRTMMRSVASTDSPSVHKCLTDKSILLEDNRHRLLTPIIDGDKVIAVVEYRKALSGFTDENVLTAKVMARHLAIFMNRVVE